MTRDEYINAHKHELGGIVLDAATRSKSGPELSLMFGQAMQRIETILGRAFDAANPKPLPVKPAAPATPAGNGPAIPVRRS